MSESVELSRRAGDPGSPTTPTDGAPSVGAPSDPSGDTSPDDTAAADAAGPASPGGAPAPIVPSRPPVRRRSRWRLGVLFAVLAGAAAFILVKGLGSSLDYFDTVDQAVHDRAALEGKTFRLEGLVQPGSVHTTPGGVTFVADGTHDRLTVVNTGSPPQLFQPDIPVVVVGHFTPTGFASDQIIVKHTEVYQEQHPKRVTAPNGTKR